MPQDIFKIPEEGLLKQPSSQQQRRRAKPSDVFQLPQSAFETDTIGIGTPIPLEPKEVEKAKAVGERTKSFLGNTVESFVRGTIEADQSIAWFQAQMGLVDEDKVRKATEEYNKMVAEDPIEAKNLFEKAIYGTAGLLPPIIKGTGQGMLVGGALAGAAVVAGQAGPQVFIPEEIVTVPGAFAAGTAVGSMNYWYQLGTGSMYRDMRMMGLSKEVAAPVAAVVGLPYAMVENSQVGKVLPKTLGRKVEKVMANSAVKAAAKMVGKFGKDWVHETGEEGVQELLQVFAEEFTKEIDKALGLSNVEHTTYGKVKQRIGKTLVDAAISFFPLLLGGRAKRTISNITAVAQQASEHKKQQKKIAEDHLKDLSTVQKQLVEKSKEEKANKILPELEAASVEKAIETPKEVFDYLDEKGISAEEAISFINRQNELPEGARISLADWLETNPEDIPLEDVNITPEDILSEDVQNEVDKILSELELPELKDISSEELKNLTSQQIEKDIAEAGLNLDIPPTEEIKKELPKDLKAEAPVSKESAEAKKPEPSIKNIEPKLESIATNASRYPGRPAEKLIANFIAENKPEEVDKAIEYYQLKAQEAMDSNDMRAVAKYGSMVDMLKQPTGKSAAPPEAKAAVERAKEEKAKKVPVSEVTEKPTQVKGENILAKVREGNFEVTQYEDRFKATLNKQWLKEELNNNLVEYNKNVKNIDKIIDSIKEGKQLSDDINTIIDDTFNGILQYNKEKGKYYIYHYPGSVGFESQSGKEIQSDLEEIPVADIKKRLLSGFRQSLESKNKNTRNGASNKNKLRIENELQYFLDTYHQEGGRDVGRLKAKGYKIPENKGYTIRSAEGGALSHIRGAFPAIKAYFYYEKGHQMGNEDAYMLIDKIDKSGVYIRYTTVKKGLRGKGIASLLLNRIRKDYPNLPIIRMMVNNPIIVEQSRHIKGAKLTNGKPLPTFDKISFSQWQEKEYSDIYIPPLKESLAQQKQTGFQGYKGGFEDKGKGTSKGDGKDKAMRKIANAFIGEIASKRPSSTLTSAKEIATKHSDEPRISEKGFLNGKGVGLHEVSVAPASLKGKNIVVMLARNGKLKGQKLSEKTKDRIKILHKEGAEFVVGDMPGVDSQFIDYLQKIGAKFTVYHTGNKSRIEVKEKLIGSKANEDFLSDPLRESMYEAGITYKGKIYKSSVIAELEAMKGNPLAEYFIKILNEYVKGINVYRVDKLFAEGKEIAGTYVTGLDIAIFINGSTSKEKQNESFLHEIVHEVTGVAFNTATPNEKQRDFRIEVGRLYRLAKKNIKTNYYYLQNEQEFIAGAITDADFQKDLSKIHDSKSKGDLLHSVLRTIKKLLGIDSSNTVLDSTFNSFFNLNAPEVKNLPKEVTGKTVTGEVSEPDVLPPDVEVPDLPDIDNMDFSNIPTKKVGISMVNEANKETVNEEDADAKEFGDGSESKENRDRDKLDTETSPEEETTGKKWGESEEPVTTETSVQFVEKESDVNNSYTLSGYFAKRKIYIPHIDIANKAREFRKNFSGFRKWVESKGGIINKKALKRVWFHEKDISRVNTIYLDIDSGKLVENENKDPQGNYVKVNRRQSPFDKLAKKLGIKIYYYQGTYVDGKKAGRAERIDSIAFKQAKLFGRKFLFFSTAGDAATEVWIKIDNDVFEAGKTQKFQDKWLPKNWKDTIETVFRNSESPYADFYKNWTDQHFKTLLALHNYYHTKLAQSMKINDMKNANFTKRAQIFLHGGRSLSGLTFRAKIVNETEGFLFNNGNIQRTKYDPNSPKMKQLHDGHIYFLPETLKAIADYTGEEKVNIFKPFYFNVIDSLPVGLKTAASMANEKVAAYMRKEGINVLIYESSEKFGKYPKDKKFILDGENFLIDNFANPGNKEVTQTRTMFSVIPPKFIAPFNNFVMERVRQFSNRITRIVKDANYANAFMRQFANYEGFGGKSVFARLINRGLGIHPETINQFKEEYKNRYILDNLMKFKRPGSLSFLLPDEPGYLLTDGTLSKPVNKGEGYLPAYMEELLAKKGKGVGDYVIAYRSPALRIDNFRVIKVAGFLHKKYGNGIILNGGETMFYHDSDYDIDELQVIIPKPGEENQINNLLELQDVVGEIDVKDNTPKNEDVHNIADKFAIQDRFAQGKQSIGQITNFGTVMSMLVNNNKVIGITADDKVFIEDRDKADLSSDKIMWLAPNWNNILDLQRDISTLLQHSVDNAKLNSLSVALDGKKYSRPGMFYKYLNNIGSITFNKWYKTLTGNKSELKAIFKVLSAFTKDVENDSSWTYDNQMKAIQNYKGVFPSNLPRANFKNSPLHNFLKHFPRINLTNGGAFNKEDIYQGEKRKIPADISFKRRMEVAHFMAMKPWVKWFKDYSKKISSELNNKMTDAIIEILKLQRRVVNGKLSYNDEQVLMNGSLVTIKGMNTLVNEIVNKLNLNKDERLYFDIKVMDTPKNVYKEVEKGSISEDALRRLLRVNFEDRFLLAYDNNWKNIPKWLFYPKNQAEAIRGRYSPEFLSQAVSDGFLSSYASKYNREYNRIVEGVTKNELTGQPLAMFVPVTGLGKVVEKATDFFRPMPSKFKRMFAPRASIYMAATEKKWAQVNKAAAEVWGSPLWTWDSWIDFLQDTLVENKEWATRDRLNFDELPIQQDEAYNILMRLSEIKRQLESGEVSKRKKSFWLTAEIMNRNPYTKKLYEGFDKEDNNSRRHAFKVDVEINSMEKDLFAGRREQAKKGLKKHDELLQKLLVSESELSNIEEKGKDNAKGFAVDIIKKKNKKFWKEFQQVESEKVSEDSPTYKEWKAEMDKYQKKFDSLISKYTPQALAMYKKEKERAEGNVEGRTANLTNYLKRHPQVQQDIYNMKAIALVHQLVDDENIIGKPSSDEWVNSYKNEVERVWFKNVKKLVPQAEFNADYFYRVIHRLDTAMQQIYKFDKATVENYIAPMKESIREEIVAQLMMEGIESGKAKKIAAKLLGFIPEELKRVRRYFPWIRFDKQIEGHYSIWNVDKMIRDIKSKKLDIDLWLNTPNVPGFFQPRNEDWFNRLIRDEVRMPFNLPDVARTRLISSIKSRKISANRKQFRDFFKEVIEGIKSGKIGGKQLDYLLSMGDYIHILKYDMMGVPYGRELVNGAEIQMREDYYSSNIENKLTDEEKYHAKLLDLISKTYRNFRAIVTMGLNAPTALKNLTSQGWLLPTVYLGKKYAAIGRRTKPQDVVVKVRNKEIKTEDIVRDTGVSFADIVEQMEKPTSPSRLQADISIDAPRKIKMANWLYEKTGNMTQYALNHALLIPGYLSKKFSFTSIELNNNRKWGAVGAFIKRWNELDKYNLDDRERYKKSIQYAKKVVERIDFEYALRARPQAFRNKKSAAFFILKSFDWNMVNLSYQLYNQYKVTKDPETLEQMLKASSVSALLATIKMATRIGLTGLFDWLFLGKLEDLVNLYKWLVNGDKQAYKQIGFGNGVLGLLNWFFGGVVPEAVTSFMYIITDEPQWKTKLGWQWLNNLGAKMPKKMYDFWDKAWTVYKNVRYGVDEFTDDKSGPDDLLMDFLRMNTGVWAPGVYQEYYKKPYSISKEGDIRIKSPQEMTK